MKTEELRPNWRYARLLAAYGAWLAAGVALVTIVTERWLLTVVLVGLTAVSITFGVRGTRLTERTLSQAEIFTQTIALIAPVIFVAVFTILAAIYFTPLTFYIAGYFVFLLILAGLSLRELFRLRGMR